MKDPYWDSIAVALLGTHEKKRLSREEFVARSKEAAAILFPEADLKRDDFEKKVREMIETNVIKYDAGGFWLPLGTQNTAYIVELKKRAEKVPARDTQEVGEETPPFTAEELAIIHVIGRRKISDKTLRHSCRSMGNKGFKDAYASLLKKGIVLDGGRAGIVLDHVKLTEIRKVLKELKR